MLIVGITGNISSGKTRILGQISSLGFPTLNSDKLSYKVLAMPQVAQEVLLFFPTVKKSDSISDFNNRLDTSLSSITNTNIIDVANNPYNTDNNQLINKKKLANLVFQDKNKLSILENIIHPYILQIWDRWISHHRRLKCKVVFIESAIIFEKNLQNYFSHIINIHINKYRQKQLFLKRSPNLTISEKLDLYHNICSQQYSSSYKSRLSNFTINNGLSKSSSLKKIKKILQNLKNTSTS